MPEVRLIDANAFVEHYGNYYAEEGPEEGFIGTVGDLIAKQPAIEAEPVRHGRWIEVTKHRDENGTILTDYECSECCAMVKDNYAEEIESERFCYNCGARMDRGVDDD